jgi:hypothetical protein
MLTAQLIGTILFGSGLVAAVGAVCYAWGEHDATERERDAADIRVRGILNYENKRKPKAAKNKRKGSRRRSTAVDYNA